MPFLLLAQGSYSASDCLITILQYCENNEVIIIFPTLETRFQVLNMFLFVPNSRKNNLIEVTLTNIRMRLRPWRTPSRLDGPWFFGFDWGFFHLDGPLDLGGWGNYFDRFSNFVKFHSLCRLWFLFLWFVWQSYIMAIYLDKPEVYGCPLRVTTPVLQAWRFNVWIFLLSVMLIPGFSLGAVLSFSLISHLVWYLVSRGSLLVALHVCVVGFCWGLSPTFLARGRVYTSFKLIWYRWAIYISCSVPLVQLVDLECRYLVI